MPPTLLMTDQKEPASAGPDYAYIDDSESLVQLISSLQSGGAKRCAIDTEADSLHCYEEKLCLVQFAADDQLAIIDPLAIDDLSPLVDYLDAVDVWLHGADFDMRMLRNTFDWIPKSIYDTQTAARLLGARKFGLANLVEEHYGIVLPKGSQKADWGKRPLSERMLEYAINDVRYLLTMADKYVDQLRQCGRWAWFLESCESARSTALEREEKDEDAVWRISGWGRLERQGMAFLRALWRWRDGEAARRDRPSFKIIGNEQLLDMARALQSGGEVGLPPRFPPGPVRRFRDAIAKAEQLPEEQWPEGPKRQRGKRDPNAEKRFDKLKETRDRAAEKHEFDGTLIASRATLEAVAADPANAANVLLSWQQELLQPTLAQQQKEQTGGS